jgi:hypothetical protein
VLFTATHGSTDPYIIVWYFVLWTSLAIITWRTGGLEIAAMLHAVLNTFAFIVAPYLRADLGAQLQDRSAGGGTPYMLVPTAAVIVVTAIVWWCTRKTGPLRTPSAELSEKRHVGSGPTEPIGRYDDQRRTRAGDHVRHDAYYRGWWRRVGDARSRDRRTD